MGQKNLKNYILLLVFSLVIVLLGSTYVFADNTIILTDSDGYRVKIKLPVKRIICLSAPLNEILIALDAGNKIIGRDDWSATSAALSMLEDVPIVASSSYRPQIESIIELNPDVIIADTMLQDDARKKFNDFAIPTIAERTSEASNLFNVIRKLAKIVNNEEKATELIAFISQYRVLIKERVAGLKEDEKTRIYWEWRGKYKTGSSKATVQPRIELAGGINICANTVGRYPEVSSEYVIQENPELIIRMESPGVSNEEMKESWKEIINRTGLKNTSAVKNDRVYVMTWLVNSGLPSVVGDLYYAKLGHPELFADIEPQAVYADLMNKFFGISIDDNKQLIFPEY
ncbi:ABC transporter substrate-binding protein [Halocella sp. SP3-1]|uniref:ABC transporter substrate-binding protein n=1 Tax=Halocella sp. SP3-1 TaxID=2382161 RepID=UPI000F74CB5B|nr:ABC transporter substrate-binding protein [Halocella sp. SP3-1]AZO95933.1 ABC transporter substrate-binding protein [Halocella sp. SP3-1]